MRPRGSNRPLMATSPTPPTPSPLPPLHTHADRVHLPPGAADADTANPVGNAGRGAAPPSKLQTLWVATKQFTAGAIAGSCAKTFIAPLDRTKILFQVSQQPFSLRAAFNLAKSVVQEEGWRALYKGNFATVARVVPYSGIQLMAFDQYRAAFRRRLGLEVGARLPPMENFLAGAAAGATSVALTYPLDLMRARLAVQRTFHRYTGLGHAFRTALSDEVCAHCVHCLFSLFCVFLGFVVFDVPTYPGNSRAFEHCTAAYGPRCSAFCRMQGCRFGRLKAPKTCAYPVCVLYWLHFYFTTPPPLFFFVLRKSMTGPASPSLPCSGWHVAAWRGWLDKVVRLA